MNDVFVAIDFETADRYRDSACALAMVRVESGTIVKTEHRLIKPPREYFEFTYIHNITWDMVVSEPGFHELWPSKKNTFKIKKPLCGLYDVKTSFSFRQEAIHPNRLRFA